MVELGKVNFLLKFITKRKRNSIAILIVVSLIIVVGVADIANAYQTITNKEKSLELAVQEGSVFKEKLVEFESNRSCAEFDTETVNPIKRNNTIVFQNTDETIQSTEIKDNNISLTGDTISKHRNIEDCSFGKSPGHSHSWHPHYITKISIVQTGTRYVIDIPRYDVKYRSESHTYCNSCGGIVDSHAQFNYHMDIGCDGSTHVESHYCLVAPAQAEQGHYETITEQRQEQFIDYYYCNCGAKK